MDFLGGSVVKNPPANARDVFDPWSGKIPHAVEQLSPCAKLKLVHPRAPAPQQKKPMQ